MAKKSKSNKVRKTNNSAPSSPAPPSEPQLSLRQVIWRIGGLTGAVAAGVFLNSFALSGVTNVTLSFICLAIGWAILVGVIVRFMREWKARRLWHKWSLGLACAAIYGAAFGWSGWYQYRNTLGSGSEAVARLRIIDFAPMPPTDRSHFFINVHFVNEGTLPVTQWRSAFVIANVTSVIPDAEIDVQFARLYKDSLMSTALTESEIQPGNTMYYSLPPGDTDVDPTIQEWQEVLNLKRYIYAFGVTQYRDATLPEGKWRYTEYCVLVVREAVRFCNKRNRMFSDN